VDLSVGFCIVHRSEATTNLPPTTAFACLPSSNLTVAFFSTSFRACDPCESLRSSTIHLSLPGSIGDSRGRSNFEALTILRSGFAFGIVTANRSPRRNEAGVVVSNPKSGI
jgi:hypothetical protein